MGCEQPPARTARALPTCAFQSTRALGGHGGTAPQPRGIRASSLCRPSLQMLTSSRASEPRPQVFKSRVSSCPGH